MSNPKREPIRFDLTGHDGKSELDVQWNPLSQEYVVRARGGRDYHWSAIQFAAYSRKWLLRQREQPGSEV